MFIHYCFKLVKVANKIHIQGVQEKLCFFHEFSIPVLPLPRKDLAAIGCTEIGQPTGVTVHSHCVESFVNPLQRCRGCSG